MSSIPATPLVGMKLRRVEPADALRLARSCHDSFLEFNESVGIPQRIDFVTFEFAVEVMKYMTGSAEVYGVVGVEEASDSIMAAGFFTPGESYSIGPVWADNAFKEKGAAKAVMVALLEKARSDQPKSIRLIQCAPNVNSFALYTKLEFLPMDCWTDLEGCVTREQAESANHAIGYQPPPRVHVRRMEDADVKICNDLHIKTNGLGREHEIRGLISDSWVATQDDKIIAYTTGFHLFGHAVAETEEALVLLFSEVCHNEPHKDLVTTFHVLGRLYPRLLQWALAAKLKVRRNCWIMVIGFYQPPQHGMVFSPSVTYA